MFRSPRSELDAATGIINGIILSVFLLIILAVLVSCGSPSTEVTDATAKITAEALIVYDCPSITCNPVGVVGVGDQVHVAIGNVPSSDQSCPEYTPIKHLGQTCYVCSSGLDRSK